MAIHAFKPDNYEFMLVHIGYELSTANIGLHPERWRSDYSAGVCVERSLC